ncbi:Rtn, c-di-GMP phosphodiesterase class I [Wenzhouxiangella marina]|uniref:Rtn, c-di-GMP phosphodiesterase class I n=2 Tax=Wenzhouxiangella marina TaxID=1579979 RepID=A0A0K0Y0A4_9GAMM|nr:Rtn, c-di-GMP phosphodiesterase class I [Wenzhouxiangella marina]
MEIAAFDHEQRQKLEDYTSVIGVGIQFAFQPVVDLESSQVKGYEALLRGRSGEPSSSIIENVLPENLAFFDQACRTRAIAEAAKLDVRGALFVNCMQIRPDNLELALSTTREQAERYGMRPEQIVLEFASLARLGNPRELVHTRERAQAHGFRVLVDNFGTGEAGLKRLAVFQPDYVKLDHELVHGIQNSRRRQAMARGVLACCQALGVEVIAAGLEQQAELRWLYQELDLRLFQGYYFARPRLAAKPRVAPERIELPAAPSAA